MDATWLATALFGTTCALITVVYATLIHRISRLEHDVGLDSKSGLRGAMHNATNKIRTLTLCVAELADHVGGDLKTKILYWLKLLGD